MARCCTVAFCRSVVAAAMQRMGERKFISLVVILSKVNTARTTDSIEGDIWQAGGEPDALIIGISFDTGKQILLKTIHVAKPGKQTSSEVDKGIFITTYPVTVR